VDAKARIIIKKSESSLEADVRIIEEDPRHLWPDYRLLLGRLQEAILAPKQIVAQRVSAGL
jgi:hypothetical protein